MPQRRLSQTFRIRGLRFAAKCEGITTQAPYSSGTRNVVRKCSSEKLWSTEVRSTEVRADRIEIESGLGYYGGRSTR